MARLILLCLFPIFTGCGKQSVYSLNPDQVQSIWVQLTVPPPEFDTVDVPTIRDRGRIVELLETLRAAKPSKPEIGGIGVISIREKSGVIHEVLVWEDFTKVGASFQDVRIVPGNRLVTFLEKVGAIKRREKQ